MSVACPNCGGTTWRVPATVEVELTWDSSVPFAEDILNRSVTAVEVVRETGNDGHDWIYAVRGEYEAVCAGCGQKLLDWTARTDDEDAFGNYHDARRPLWDELNDIVSMVELPEPTTWTSPMAVLEPAGEWMHVKHRGWVIPVSNPGGYPEPGILVGRTVEVAGHLYLVRGVESFAIARPYPDRLDFALLVAGDPPVEEVDARRVGRGSSFGPAP